MMLSFKDAKAACKSLGYKLTQDTESFEFCAVPIDAKLSAKKREALTIYTNDLDDAVGTVIAEAKATASR
jgi:hypothetical protein